MAASPHPNTGKAQFFKLAEIVNVAAVNYQRPLQQFLNPAKVQFLEFIPFSQNQQAIRAAAGIVGIPAKLYALQYLSGLANSPRVVNPDIRAFPAQLPDAIQRPGLAGILRVRPESDAQDSDKLI